MSGDEIRSESRPRIYVEEDEDGIQIDRGDQRFYFSKHRELSLAEMRSRDALLDEYKKQVRAR